MSLGPALPALLAACQAALNSAFREASLGGASCANADSDINTANSKTPPAAINFCTKSSRKCIFDETGDTTNDRSYRPRSRGDCAASKIAGISSTYNQN